MRPGGYLWSDAPAKPSERRWNWDHLVRIEQKTVDAVRRRLDVERVVHPSAHPRKTPEEALVVVRRVDIRGMLVAPNAGQCRHQLGPLPDQRPAANITFEILEVCPQLAGQNDRRMKEAVEAQSGSGKPRVFVKFQERVEQLAANVWLVAEYDDRPIDIVIQCGYPGQ